MTPEKQKRVKRPSGPSRHGAEVTIESVVC